MTTKDESEYYSWFIVFNKYSLKMWIGKDQDWEDYIKFVVDLDLRNNQQRPSQKIDSKVIRNSFKFKLESTVMNAQ